MSSGLMSRWRVKGTVAAFCCITGLVPVSGQDAAQNETAHASAERAQAIEALKQRSATNTISQTLRDVIDQLDSTNFRWALKVIQNTGLEVKQQDFSWQIGLRIKGTDRRCGGILISQSYVLTAAHCLDRLPVAAPGPAQPYSAAEIEIFGASAGFGERPLPLDGAWAVRLHQSYKTTGIPYAYDAALIRLAVPLTSATPAPVGRRAFKTGPAVTSGWGDHPSGASGTLRAVVVPVVDATLCRDHLAQQRWDQLGPQTICTIDDTADACARDSGGPLVIGTRQKPQTVGIVSWGGQPCGRRGANDALLGGYTRASVIADWVRTETGDKDSITDSAPGTIMTVTTAITLGGS